MTKEIIVSLMTMSKDGLVNTFNSVPEDKLTWKPLDNGRTPLDLFSEAAQFPALLADIAKSKGQIDPAFNLMAHFGQMKVERANWTKAEALDQMEKGHIAMMAAIEELSEEDFGLPVAVPMRSGAINPIGFWLMMCYRAYVSRFAQINYIQTLYGDFDFH